MYITNLCLYLILIVSLMNPNTDLRLHALALGWAHSKAQNWKDRNKERRSSPKVLLTWEDLI